MTLHIAINTTNGRTHLIREAESVPATVSTYCGMEVRRYWDIVPAASYEPGFACPRCGEAVEEAKRKLGLGVR
jgi:hypothetical protein